MRIVLIAPSIEDYSLTFASAVATAADVLLIAPKKFFKDRPVPQGQRIEVLQADWPRLRSLRNVFFLVWLFRAIRRYRPDLVHCLSEKTIWLNFLAPFLRGSPLVTTVHDVQYHPGDVHIGSVPQWCTRLFIWQSNALIVHGHKLRQLAIEHFPTDEKAIHVIPHVAMPVYRDLAKREGLHRARGGAPMVLFFGRIRRYKGLDVLVSAAQRIAAELHGVHFVIAGEPDRESKPLLGKAASFCDVRARYVPVVEAAQLFLDAKVLVLPYTEASQSGVLAVACTFGLPAVATNVGELGATVAENRTGLVVPARDPEALAGAVLKLLRDEALWASLSENARKLADTEWSSAAVGAKAAAVYDQVVKSAQRWRSRATQQKPKSETL
jgi:glycosyltransferase involved in cell wall biosynthesis